MENLWTMFVSSLAGYFRYLGHQITHPGWDNFFYWIIGVSLVVWVLEIIVPWRKGQAPLRKDFWLDAWWMMFNFFLFTALGYGAVSDVVTYALRSGVTAITGITNFAWIDVSQLPTWAQFAIMFVVVDFIKWNVHRWLHASPRLWEFHKLHHSVEQMGFAAHMRYHWMENVVYNAVLYVPLAFFGFGATDFFALHIFTTLIGHLNHANINVPMGPLKYILNSPQMHIWHHAHDLPPGKNGVNYGITLSVWDWLFGEAYIPSDGRDIVLGFKGVEQYPHSFIAQNIEPFAAIVHHKRGESPRASS
jgi:sterol desaturase/sphingolipid hydroxylase (fatty acid hydroxylase superfamily)